MIFSIPKVITIFIFLLTSFNAWSYDFDFAENPAADYSVPEGTGSGEPVFSNHFDPVSETFDWGGYHDAGGAIGPEDFPDPVKKSLDMGLNANELYDRLPASKRLGRTPSELAHAQRGALLSYAFDSCSSNCIGPGKAVESLVPISNGSIVAQAALLNQDVLNLVQFEDELFETGQSSYTFEQRWFGHSLQNALNMVDRLENFVEKEGGYINLEDGINDEGARHITLEDGEPVLKNSQGNIEARGQEAIRIGQQETMERGNIVKSEAIGRLGDGVPGALAY